MKVRASCNDCDWEMEVYLVQRETLHAAEREHYERTGHRSFTIEHVDTETTP